MLPIKVTMEFLTCIELIPKFFRENRQNKEEILL